MSTQIVKTCNFFYNTGVVFTEQIVLEFYSKNKGNNKITELRTILQRESQNP
jgi:hypothetical protein